MNTSRRRPLSFSFLPLTLVVALSSFSSFAAAEDIVYARWCDAMGNEDKADNQTISFVWTEAETYEARMLDTEGTTVVQELSMLPGNVYVKAGDVYGDRYRIHPNTEDLHLMNNEGTIRIASKLEIEPVAGDCF